MMILMKGLIILKNDLSTIKDKIPKHGNIKLTSEHIGEIIVENIGETERFNIKNNISCKKENLAIILSDKYDIYIRFGEINELLDTDVQNAINRVVEKESKHLKDGGWVNYSKNKYHGIAWTTKYNCNNDSITFIPEQTHYNANKSSLEIAPGVGMGIVKNELLTDLNFRLGKYNTRKGILKRHQYISYSLLYNFNTNNTYQINQFINLGYRINLSNSLNKYQWTGIEIGYLLSSQGDVFKTPTFKFSTMIDFANMIKISPEIYFEHGFKKVYPGIRIGVEFINW